MLEVSPYLNTTFKEFIEEYTRKQNRFVFKFLTLLIFSKKIRLILERLSKSSPDVLAYDDVKDGMQELGKMSDLMIWVAGFFFQLMRSRVLYVYRFLDVMHQSSKLNNIEMFEDFVSYPLLEEFIGHFDYFWVDNHWLDIKHKVMNHAKPFSLLHALVGLHKTDILYDWSITKILPVLMKNKEPLKLLIPLKRLVDANMLSGQEGYANLAVLEQYSSPVDLADALIQLKQIGLLNQNMRAILLTQSKPLVFSQFVACLFFSGQLLAQQQVTTVSEILPFTAIFTSQTISRFWINIPPAGITSNIYRQMLEICRLPNTSQIQKEQQLVDFLNQTFFPNQTNFLLEQRQNNFNPSQSVHTASINQSLRDSILNLKKRYASQIENGQQVLKYYTKLKELVFDKCHTLEHDIIKKNKCDAAIRALNRIDSGELIYDEKATNTDIYSLLALIYCAVHDKDRIKANLDDFLMLLIDSLYEIQRGYNLSEKAQDNNLADHSICFGGSFVKIFESISALHQDCCLIYVTAQSITNKMIRVVNEEIKTYLEQLPYENSIKLLTLLKENGLNEDIWQMIKLNVEAKMHAEFDDILGMSSVSKADFKEILESASDVPLYLDEYQLPSMPSLANQFFNNNGADECVEVKNLLLN